MFDLKHIRETPEFYDSGWQRRGLAPQTPKIIEMDEKRRALQTEMQDLQASRNALSKDIGAIKSKGGDASDIMAKVAEMKERIARIEEDEKKIAEELQGFLGVLPNIPDASVPDGKDEKDNKEARRHGEPPRINSARDHTDIGEGLGGMDFETAAKMSGARFVLLKSGVARLERALAQFMLDTHTQEHGYTELSVPLLVRDEALYGTGQLPKFAEDLFRTSTGHWLIPTSEVSLTNTVLDTILDAADLPLRLTSLTPCFRSEAGAAGKDTRGMIRQHQFYKVELVSITAEDKSMDELERMTNCAETILKKLGLAFRTMALCTGDMGFSAKKTFDIEVWLPGQNTYREISSCSNCGDFQARRMMARYKAEGDKQTRYVHTLNGSGVAVGRCLIAVLENYQQADGSVVIPDALLPYMGGIKKLEPAGEVKSGKVA
ncbi:MAG TPA: serine--tRNA ligase [Alphaproteobacteria bacterium]|nr:serine--tRNA ligase [Alphaproteobacteria bacterium]